MFTIEYTLQPGDLEPIYDHVHHAHSLRFLERARVEYLASVGCPMDELFAKDIFLVISKIEIRYLREVLDGTIAITCENPRIEGRALVIDQRILNAKGKACVEARVDSMCMSSATKRAFAVPDFLRDAFVGTAGGRP